MSVRLNNDALRAVLTVHWPPGWCVAVTSSAINVRLQLVHNGSIEREVVAETMQEVNDHLVEFMRIAHGHPE
jgi:hypothetical protein